MFNNFLNIPTDFIKKYILNIIYFLLLTPGLYFAILIICHFNINTIILVKFILSIPLHIIYIIKINTYVIPLYTHTLITEFFIILNNSLFVLLDILKNKYVITTDNKILNTEFWTVELFYITTVWLTHQIVIILHQLITYFVIESLNSIFFILPTMINYIIVFLYLENVDLINDLWIYSFDIQLLLIFGNILTLFNVLIHNILLLIYYMQQIDTYSVIIPICNLDMILADPLCTYYIDIYRPVFINMFIEADTMSIGVKPCYIQNYSFILHGMFFILLTVQLSLVSYYSIIKDLNYRLFFNLMNVILLLQLILSLFLMLINKTANLAFNETINSNFMIFNVFVFKFDKLTWLFTFTVYIISFFVHAYQFLYIKDSSHKEQFLIKLNIFILSMIGIVLSSNWLLLLLSWEVLGQSSFFLIGFFKNKPSAFKSSYKAFFFNKISDITLILAFVLYYKCYISVNYDNLVISGLISEVIGVLLAITALVKSAQFFFYFWLPDSMEAPIPASALIHSATLVSAGIYLILRFKTFIENNIYTDFILLISSPVTMVLASLIALNQTDIKKLLAYSTISNCAFIYFILYLKNYEISQYYFTIHGIIKSLSFLIAGALIQLQNHQQDIRQWELRNFNEVNLIILLALSLLLLSTTPLTIIYNIKTQINNMHVPSGNWTLYIQICLVLYTINSYLYGIKIFIILINKKFRIVKFKNNMYTDKIHLLYINKIIITYYVCILITILFLYIWGFYNQSLIYTWQWFISVLVTSILILSNRFLIKEVLLLISLSILLLIFLF